MENKKNTPINQNQKAGGPDHQQKQQPDPTGNTRFNNDTTDNKEKTKSGNFSRNPTETKSTNNFKPDELDRGV